MITIYFVTLEQFNLFNDKLDPGARWMSGHVDAMGVRNLICGKKTVVAICPKDCLPDEILPDQFYKVTGLKPAGVGQ